MNYDNLTLNDAFMMDAPTPVELTQWLTALDALFEVHTDSDREGGICIAQMDAYFEIEVHASCFRDRHRLLLPEGNILFDSTKTETKLGWIVNGDIRRRAISYIPYTKAHLQIAMHWLAKHGKHALVAELSRVKPDQPLYLKPERITDDLVGGIRNAKVHGHYPRVLADIGVYLTTKPTEVRAEDVRVYMFREIGRLANGEYERLPERIKRMIPVETYLKEIPHLATKTSNLGKIAYTENAKKGAADTQSVMKPGKYLRRVLKDKDISDKELKEMVAEMTGAVKPEFKVTKCPEEAAQVYMDGPQSCMSYGEDRFNQTFGDDGSWYHPIEALFNPDGSGGIELHYMIQQGRIAARALLNPASNEYPAVYVADWAKPGGEHRFFRYLEEIGATEAPDALRGIRIRKIDLVDGNVLCPYIDHGNQGVEFIDDETLEIGGDYEPHHEHGFVNDGSHQITCDHCEERFDEDEITEIETEDERICDGCLDSYPYALDNYGDVERRYINGLEYLDFDYSYHGIYFGYVTDDISQSTLEEVGLCRTVAGDIQRQTDCFEANDGEWVPDHDVDGDTVAPETFRNVTYIGTDDGVEHVNNCIWLEDERRWVHENAIDHDTHDVYFRNWYNVAVPKEADDEAA